jgi:hypothetical protein
LIITISDTWKNMSLPSFSMIISDNQAQTCWIITINDTSIGDLPLIITISDTWKNQPKRLDSDNTINLYDHAEKDIEESQRGSGQDEPEHRCPLEKELLGRHPHDTASALTAQCRMSTLELPRCEMIGQDAERLAGVLAQCAALTYLDLSGNFNFGPATALPQCKALAHLALNSGFWMM